MSLLKRSVPTKAELDISLKALAVKNGSPFEGSVILRAHETLKVDELIVEARVVESWEEEVETAHQNGNLHRSLERRESVLYSREVPLSLDVEAKDGEGRAFPFLVEVPMVAPFRSWGVVNYTLRAVAKVEGRPDLEKTVSTMVVPAASDPGADLPVLEVTHVLRKEVVKIQCQACGALAEPGSLSELCPRCGAKLRLQ